MTFGLLALAASSGTASADDRKPDPVTGLTAAPVSSSTVRLDWETPFDDVGVTGYDVFRDGSYRATVRDTAYTDAGAGDGAAHTYRVVAFDAALNRAEPSPEATVAAATPFSTRSGGDDRPPAPTGLSVESADESSVTLSWPEMGGEVEGYNVYRDGRYHTTVRATSYVDTGVEPGREYLYQLTAFTYSRLFSVMSEGVPAQAGSGAEARVAGRAEASSDGADDGDSGSNDAASNDPSSGEGSPDDSGSDDSGSDADRDDSGDSDPAPSSSGAPDGYRLVFSDDFRDGSIDGSKWTTRYRWGPDWIINNERQYYVDVQRGGIGGASPFELDGERLTISARRTPDELRGRANGQPWISGAMTTYGKFSMRYGYVEMRAKFPAGQGLWPAFWLLHEGNGGNRPEIDVVEFVGKRRDRVYQTYHYYENYVLRSTPSFEVGGGDWSADFHTYAMRWEPGRITWYVDGRETNRYESSNVSSESMYLLVNLALGGVWNGDPDGSTPSPARYTIDWIRAYSPQ